MRSSVVSGTSMRNGSIGGCPMTLGVHPDDQLPEVLPLEHADEGSRRALETIDNILTVADAAVGDAGTDLAEEVGIVLGGKFAVDEAAHGQALRQDLAHGGGQPVGAVALSHAVVLRDQDRKS